jgi:hypothetical protein
MRISFFCVALAACGGIIDTGDAGNSGVDSGGANDGSVVKKDATTIVDTGIAPSCTQVQTATEMDSNGGCQASASWSCGDTKYTVQCNCPSTQCTCAQTTGSSSTGVSSTQPLFCPKCDATQLPSLCGFPTN